MANQKYSRKRSLERVHRKAHVRVDLPLPSVPAPINNSIRLTIQDLPGLKALEQKYADDIEHGRSVSDKLE